MQKQASDALCARCAWAGGCLIPGESDEPVVNCETFEPLDMLWRNNGLKSPRPDPSRAEGLCVDCGNRRSCVFRAREGGIWHCEEYC